MDDPTAPAEPETPHSSGGDAGAHATVWVVLLLTLPAQVAAMALLAPRDASLGSLLDPLPPHRDKGAGLGDLLAGFFRSSSGELRRPLFWAADAARAIFEPEPARWVATFLLGLTLASAAWLVLRPGRGRAGWWAAAAAILPLSVWAVHPLRIEPVLCASQLGTLLGTSLLATAAKRWRQRLSSADLRPADGWMLAATVTLAVLADPTLCFAPLALWALTRWTLRETSPRPDRTGAPLALASIPCALALVASLACREPGGGAPFGPSILAACSALVRPLRATLWPFDLHPAYDPPADFPAQIAPSLWVDAVSAAAILAACLWGLRRSHGLGFALTAYLSLVAGRILFARDPVGADADAHAATLPLFVAAGVGASDAVARAGKLQAPIALGASVALGAFLVPLLARSREPWADERTLAAHIQRIDPSNERALVALGDSARRAGAPVADLAHWYGLALASSDWRPLAHARIGGTLLETGDAAGARRHLERAVEIAPWIAAARFDLGTLDLREGKFAAARTHLEAACRLDSESPEPWRVLAQACDALGDATAMKVAAARAARLRR